MKVSIITVVYNRENTIARTIESVLSQDYENIEYIIVDGNSVDGTCNIIKQYDKKINKFISEPDAGIYDALNKGIKLASGDVVGLLHSDDVFTAENVISKIANSFSENDFLDAVFADVSFVRTPGSENIIRYYSSRNFNPGLFKNGMMPAHPSFFCRKEIFSHYGFYRTDMSIAADFELLLRLLYKYKITYKYLPICTTVMTLGGASTSGIKSNVAINKEFLQALKEHQVDSNYIRLYSRYLVKWKEFFRR